MQYLISHSISNIKADNIIVNQYDALKEITFQKYFKNDFVTLKECTGQFAIGVWNIKYKQL